MKKTRTAAAIAAIGLLLAGCTREDVGQTPHAIRFGARTGLTHSTKTTYSGDVDASTSVERINWDDGDRIRVHSEEASSPASHQADYVLTRTSKDGVHDYASAAPAGSSGRGLAWGSGTHRFYAVYPAPSSGDAAPGNPVIGCLDGNGVVEAVLQADQSAAAPKRTEGGPGTPARDYYGNMDLAYMVAAASGSEDGGDVSLSFTPVVTTFYVSVTNTTGAPMTLRKVALASSSSAMTGRYRITVTPSGNRSYMFHEEEHDRWVSSLVRNDANSAVYAAFPDGLPLLNGQGVTVALFAIPKDITNLTLTVTSDEQGRVSLPLNYQGSPCTFTGGNKHDLDNLGVPAVSYALSLDKTVLTYGYTGTASEAQEFTVTHTKTVGPNTAPAAWKTQIRDGNGDWTDLEGNCPDWLRDFPLNSTGRTTANPNVSETPAAAHTFRKDVTPQPVTSHEERLRTGKVLDATGAEWDNTAKDNAVDLSKYNFISRRLEPNYALSASRTTANTYVVAAPGWYKIPMVYGNLIENGTTVADACKGARWELGHLDYFKKSTDANIYLGVNYPWIQASFLDHAGIHWEKYTRWEGTHSVTTGRQWSEGTDAGVVRNVMLDNQEEYMYFEVDTETIRPGNVLLATYDSDGNCCWSWHVWITDQRMDLVQVDGNSVLPVNLGWIDDTEGQHYAERSCVLRFVSTAAEGLRTPEMTVIQPEFDRVSTSGWQTYYQWGRKDPLSVGVTNTYNDDGAVNKSIQHPSNIMYDESNFGTGSTSEYYDWTSANYNNLWDSQNRSWATPSTGLPDHKTVYDPSPRGFCVPPDNAWDGLAVYGFLPFENGLHFYTDGSHERTVYFPASGLMHYATATISEEGSGGFYWTNHPGQNAQRRASYSLRFRRDQQDRVSVVPKSYAADAPFTTQSFRAFGYSVRPVLYNASAAASDDIEGSLMQEVVFAEHAAGWGWSDGEDLSSGSTVTAGDVSVKVSRDVNLIGNDPTYSESDGAVTLCRDNSLKVSVPAGHQVIQVNLFFSAGDGTLAINPTPSTSDGATFSGGGADKDAVWRIGSYSGNTFTPATNEVTFSTPYAWSSNRKIYGLSVIYL